MPRSIRPTLISAVPLLLLGACATFEPEQPIATSSLIRSDGSVIGSVDLYPQPTAVLLRISATGLPPGQHGVHVHETGRCYPPKFDSAGGHWNPTGREHGHRNPQGAHMGDLGNVGVGPDGVLTAGLLIPGAALYPQGDRPGLRDADGAALVLHAGPDDEVTDPSGDSGARLACAAL